MSHPVNDTIMEELLDSLDRVVVCPYCYRHNQLDPPLLCCGEVHAEEAWETEDGEIIRDSELEEYMTREMAKRG